MICDKYKNYHLTTRLVILLTLVFEYVENTSKSSWGDRGEYQGATKLKFDGCNRNGWSCNTFPDGEMKVTYSCPKDFEVM